MSDSADAPAAISPVVPDADDALLPDLPSPRRTAAQLRARRYKASADATSTLRAYEADWEDYTVWCRRHQVVPMPATPDVVGEYIASLAGSYAMSTIRRRVAAIARANRMAGHPLDTRHPDIRDVMRGIGRQHGEPARRAAAITTEDIRKLVAVCPQDLAGLRDRAILLVGFAGALRRSELVGLLVEHVTWTTEGMSLLIPRSKTDAEGKGTEIGIPKGRSPLTCPVRALQRWLDVAAFKEGPAFRKVNRWGGIETAALSGEAVRLIVRKHAAKAGVAPGVLESMSPHGLRAGFITSAYRAGITDEEIMKHSRHKTVQTMRGYVRRARLTTDSPAGKVGL